jgi:hypothetical protein
MNFSNMNPELKINAQSLSGVATATTIVEDAAGAVLQPLPGPISGLDIDFPVPAPGLYMATSTLLDANQSALGQIRKMFGESDLRYGVPNAYVDYAGTGHISVSVRQFNGNFYFSGTKADFVRASAVFTVPLSFDLSNASANSIQIGVGNILDTATFDSRGSLVGSSRHRIKSLKLSCPKNAKTVVIGSPVIVVPNSSTAMSGKTSVTSRSAPPPETRKVASLSVTIEAPGLSDAGFDSEGIENTPAASGTSPTQERLIQFIFYLDGEVFEALVPVNFAQSTGSNPSGTISARH